MSRFRITALAAAHVILAGLLALAIASRAGFAAHAGLHLLLFLPLGLLWIPVLRNPRGSGGGLGLMLAAALLSRALFVLTPPTLSGDLYRVIWEGRVLAAGHDPWAEAPDHPALAGLREELPEIRERVEYEKLPAIYPPLSQLAGFALTSLSTDPRVLKAALVGMEALLVLGLWLMLRDRGRNPLLLAAWAWNPLPLTEIAGSGHLDVLGIGLLILGVMAADRGRAPFAAVLAALSGLAKLAGFAVLPLLLRRAGGSPLRLLGSLAAAFAVVLLVTAPLPGASGMGERLSDLTFSLTHFARHWRFNESLFLVLEALAGERARMLAAALVAGLLGVLFLRRTPPSLGCWWLAGSVFLLSPVAHPWYLLWALPFAVIHPEHRALPAATLTLSATVVLSYGPFWSTPPGDPWVLAPALRAAEYLPPLCAALLGGWFRRPGDRQSGS